MGSSLGAPGAVHSLIYGARKQVVYSQPRGYNKQYNQTQKSFASIGILFS